MPGDDGTVEVNGHQAEEPARVQGLAGHDAMMLCNSQGWAPAGRVGDLMIPRTNGRGDGSLGVSGLSG